MKKACFSLVLILTLSWAPLGCRNKPEKAEREKQQSEQKTVMHEAGGIGEGTKASGKELWEALKAANYEKTWKMWPGKSAFYPGTQPHGALLTTYVNDYAYAAIEAKQVVLPYRSIIVKQNYTPEKKLESVTVMYKIMGYNPEADDWFWAKYTPEGKVDEEGKIESCIACHGQKKANDYIQTAPLK